jgi:hypothetical protein
MLERLLFYKHLDMYHYWVHTIWKKIDLWHQLNIFSPSFVVIEYLHNYSIFIILIWFLFLKKLLVKRKADLDRHPQVHYAKYTLTIHKNV